MATFFATILPPGPRKARHYWSSARPTPCYLRRRSPWDPLRLCSRSRVGRSATIMKPIFTSAYFITVCRQRFWAIWNHDARLFTIFMLR